MSFFLKENFVLPNNTFQDGIDIVTSGNGTVYQDGTYGYSKQFADVDASFLVTADPIELNELFKKSVSISIRYHLDALADGDYVFILRGVHNASQPVVGGAGDGLILYLTHRRSGASYYEVWRYYDTAGTAWYYRGSTSAWTNTSTDYVRVSALNTWYTLGVTWDPVTKTYTITNGSETSTTNTVYLLNTDPFWFQFCGDSLTGNYYGQIAIDYIYVEDISARQSFSLRNSLTEGIQKTPFLTLLNNLTEQQRQSFTLRNSILDHEPFRSDFTLLNKIGAKGRLVNLDGTPVTRAIQETCYDNVALIFIDGKDVSDYVEAWGIDYDDMMVSKNVSVTVRDGAFAEKVTPYRFRDIGFRDARIEVRVNGYSLGSFFLQEKTEDRDSKSYSAAFSGPSKTVVLDTPFSPSRQTLLESDDTKRGIAGSLALAEGIGLVWEIPDSILYAGSLTVDERTPMEVIQEIVEAGGGRVITDRTDNIHCCYKVYETAGQTPILQIDSSAVIDYSYSQQIPNGENSIEVSGYEDMSITGGWPTIILISNKMKLLSNGYDSALLTARCWNADKTIPTVELVEEEESDPASNDHYEIPVSEMIDTAGGGVVEIKRKDTGAAVAKPYKVLSDKRTIRVTTALVDTTYQITYWGGETVSFSVDQLADVSPAEVLVENGVACATLRASAGGGGFATVSADYLDTQTAKLAIQIADPRVGSLDVTADPSSIDPSGTSTIKVKVYDSDGAAAQNGLSVIFFIEEGNGHFDINGLTHSTTSTTSTETIVEGTVKNPSYSDSEAQVSTRYPITALTSIYRIINGSVYTDVNYASGATVVKNTITLATTLPYPDTQLVINYTSSGMAQTTFYAPSSVLYEGEINRIRVFCGEYGACTVTVNNPGGGGGVTGGGGGGRPADPKLYWANFKDNFSPGPLSDGRKTFTKTVGCPSDYQLEVLIEKVDIKKLDGGQVVDIVPQRVWYNSVDIDLIMRAEIDDSGPNNTQEPTGNISGSRKVEDEDTKAPIANAMVVISWPAGGEPLTTNAEGIFYFKEGVSGTYPIAITRSGYEDLSSTITIPGDPPAQNPDAKKWKTCIFDINVPFRYII